MSGRESEEAVFQEFLKWKRARSLEPEKEKEPNLSLELEKEIEPNLSQSSSDNSGSSVEDINLEEPEQKLEQKETEEKKGKNSDV